MRPGPPAKKKGSGCLGIASGVMFGIVAAVVLLAGGCIALVAGSRDSDFVVVQPDTDSSGADDVASPTQEPDSDDLSESSEPGSRENPLALGELHSRPIGFTGTGWDVSIDKLERVGLGQFASAEDTGECLVVSGTATAREVDTEDGLSNTFSFPEVVVVVGGVQINSFDSAFACDAQPTGYEGYLTSTDMSLAEGGSAQWVKSFNIRDIGAEIDWVAIEQVIYALE